MSTHLTGKGHVKAVASMPHTIGSLLAILVIAIVASRSPIAEWPQTLTSQHERLLLYVRIIALQCLWVGYVWFGMRHSTTTLRTLIDESRWTTLVAASGARGRGVVRISRNRGRIIEHV